MSDLGGRSVRVAWAQDAPALARLQLTYWAERLGSPASGGPGVGLPSDAEVAATWDTSLRRPGDSRNRVLVALEGPALVGYAVLQPDPDPDADPVRDAQLAELAVDPAHRAQGHGSRLLHACVETLEADRFSRVSAWLDSDDDTGRAFLTSSGWGPDGAHRELDADGTGRRVVRQVRLHAGLTDPA
ncbi:GNAT family N-acetyltransferase [Nocardioides alkalitolerans]|uniref:GNAT family N-acetyltransferase n=1 Tax=Nocardioides alkalitolerans TaxID=281714 RepID=UPI00041B32D3|nr:GNAT family N-acetyltransferase [Nocardioides alkalitolerans]